MVAVSAVAGGPGAASTRIDIDVTLAVCLIGSAGVCRRMHLPQAIWRGSLTALLHARPKQCTILEHTFPRQRSASLLLLSQGC